MSYSITEIKQSPMNDAISTIRFIERDLFEGLNYGISKECVAKVFKALNIPCEAKDMTASEFITKIRSNI